MTKASRLIEAATARLPVPLFVVVDASVSDSDVAVQLDRLLTDANLLAVNAFSVRSSADVEDGNGRSFAGQFETFLCVQKSDLVQAIIDCRESANSARVATYTKGSQHQIVMEVIVQEMIQADISGVAFSAHPNGMLNEAVLVVGKGAGTVVGDEVDATSYYYHLDENVYYYEQVNGSPLLDITNVTDIIALLRQCMAQQGRYIDIEFAIKNGKVWLLQVRPITTIAADDIVVFDDHNIIESYPGVSLPLTQSFVTIAYTSIFRRLIERALGPTSAQRYDPTVQQMVRAVNGRMYYQVSSWYTILELLPFRKKILDVWQEMIGVNLASIRHDTKAHFRDRVKIVCMIITNTFTLPQNMQRLHTSFEETEGMFRRKKLDSLSAQELLRLYTELSDTVIINWDLTLSNDMYAFVYTALYKWRVGKSATLRTEQELPSTRLIKSYDELAKQMASGVMTNFDEKLRTYTEEFGDRVPGELKLETETFRQNPKLLLKQLASYKETQSTVRKNEVTRNHQGGVLAQYFHGRAALGIYNRELSRLDRAKIFGMVRDIMVAIGVIMKNNADITDARDIFYMTLEEVRAYKKGTSFKVVIAARIKHYAQLGLLPAYSRLVFSSRAIVEKQVRAGVEYTWADDAGSLFGTPCSPGVVEGEALVVNKIDNSLNVKNKILVAETTDPGWVFLLMQANGIIAERGSLLSHTAIVSRELHKPSVVGVISATRRIKTGDMIRLDGSTGRIEILA